MHDLHVEMQRRGETPLPRQVAVWRTEFRRDLRVAWRLRLSQPSAGHAVIAAVSPLFEEWLERGHGVLSFRITQVLTGHGKFGRFLHRMKEERTPGCRHCVDRPEDTVKLTVECPAWAEHRRVLEEAIGSGDLLRRALVQAMVRSEEAGASGEHGIRKVVTVSPRSKATKERGRGLVSMSLTRPPALPKSGRSHSDDAPTGKKAMRYHQTDDGAKRWKIISLAEGYHK
ncbi:hypothetical protein PYW07_002257 [Mythimna separata]|uniref:Reverse transcriptase n=1 Tax=Mythimna separata TaxID=271217 RepID=A0AAD7YP96_MYTSE|nr:hypothetical protein PYW07_002257 [Mythimna separata]